MIFLIDDTFRKIRHCKIPSQARNDIFGVVSFSTSYTIPALLMSFPRLLCHSHAYYVIPAEAGIHTRWEETNIERFPIRSGMTLGVLSFPRFLCHSHVYYVIPAIILSFPRKRESTFVGKKQALKDSRSSRE